MAAGAARRLEWQPGARRAFQETLSRIAQDDPHAADLVLTRTRRAMDLILEHPGLGTPAARRGERRFPVPATGHVFHYRVSRNVIRIVLWYRARQRVRA
ncbi:MAG: type II toxin-antitoxin system RelE/ParE family toxin [Burkholderiales bacterium]